MTGLRSSALATVFVAALGVPLAATAPASAAAPVTYTHAQAAKEFRAHGVSWTSSGHCDNRNDSRCTSFTGIRRTTVAGVIALKRTSHCAVTVTAGTEKGHSRTGKYRHDNGYKVDLHVTNCLDTYIRKHFRSAGTRGDGAKLYKSSGGNVYAYEKPRKGALHWDVTYYNGSA
ncbi:hypothetical protein AB0N77_02890 [Streptomyces misionensis]